MKPDASLRDYFYKKRKRESDPNYAFKARVKSSDSMSSINSHVEPLEPMESMVVDPVLSEARAQESFHMQRLSSGYEAYRNGQIDSAADDQNARLYLESQDNQAIGGGDQGFYDPMQDPRAPGYPSFYGMPPHPQAMPHMGNPMNAFGVINMFLGGY